MKSQLKRFRYEYPQSRPPYGWVRRWAVYEADAKKAIEEAYKQGVRDGQRLLAVREMLK